MKLYVCWVRSRPSEATPAARPTRLWSVLGSNPRYVKSGGCYRTDPLFPRRREVKRMTGNYKVPTLVLDDGTIIDGSQNIIDWAQALEAAGLRE